MPPRVGNRLDPSAVVALTLLSVTWSWWSWKDGAYFGVVVFPGIVLLCAGVGLLAYAAPWRANFELSPPARWGLLALVGLALWSALSALWSPAPDVAIRDGQRVLMYALAFGLGIWLCNLLGRRMQLAMLPLVIAGAFTGIATVITMLGADTLHRYLEVDGTLDFPLGYRNANAAFFAISFWAALALAQARIRDWRLRGPAFAVAVLCLSLCLVCQSRGSIIAGTLSLAVYVTVSRDRARAVAWLLLALIPAALAIPAFTDLYHAANDGTPAETLTQLHGAGRAIAVSAGLALLIGFAGIWLEMRYVPDGVQLRRANRVVAVICAVTVAAAAIAFVAAVGSPSDWVGQRVQEFNSNKTPEGGDSTRFSLNAASQRADLWRVALDDAGRDPLFGDGGGGFEYSYAQHRNSEDQTARDAHSVELETLSELGIPGLALLLVVFVGGTAGALRSRALGPEAAALSTAALTVGSYWLVHTSLDWFWPYPAVTAPVLALIGSACAPAMLSPSRERNRRARRLLMAAAALFALTAVPPFLADRYTADAYAVWPNDLSRAYSDLGSAEDLDPLSVDPLLAEGVIARAALDRDRAVSAFQAAVDKRPEEWAAHYYLGLLYAREQPGLARNELLAAQELNPRSLRVRIALQRLRERSAVGPAS